ncbi:hypothetical protein H5410_040491 [Solanum commersonii]|uniref:Uncharacterized protein n=1 Tax=Solanum commersonii TaxID=4109 RepID=A0A9J5XP24_SOLCO|nr:hypothetical protein H5410_040491 [Solanum commersonii]
MEIFKSSKLRKILSQNSSPKMCYERLFGAISRDRRSTQRSALWSVPSSFCFGLQQLQVL